MPYHNYCDMWSMVTCKVLSVEEGESARVDRTYYMYAKHHFQPTKCTSSQEDGFCGLGNMHRSGSLQPVAWCDITSKAAGCHYADMALYRYGTVK